MQVSLRSAEAISNAFQINVKGKLLAEIQDAICRSESVRAAARATFGCERVALKNAKILFAELGAAPQIPHADDHCNRELFGVCHLLDGQVSVT